MTDRPRRLGLVATLTAGASIFGFAVYGVAALDGPMADAAQRQKVHQQLVRQMQAPAAADGPCPHRFDHRARPSRDDQQATDVTL